MSLSQLRKSLRSARRAITPLEREEKSQLLARNLARYLPFRRCKKFAVYLSLPEEVDTSPVIELAQLLRKAIYLPVIDTRVWQKQSMMFALYLPGETPLRENRFGIREPAVKPGNCIRGIDIEFVCVPVVGFNDRCDRIGMGGGYYDKAFDSRRFQQSKLVGLAFEGQQADFEPATHDVPMQAVITEDRVIERVPRGSGTN
ncbi:MAG: 5-formyltetrahydrofolate cyclo-ligase [Pseudomonadales bacterium]|nr:5-formyltetrahydrofolate cyclo-ligase [Pseudomonadales bacterium]